MPALTGHRDSDWNAFAAVYQKVTSQLPASPAQRQELAAAAMTGMVAGFYPGAADQVLQAIPATGAKLHGLILDLRGNGGGSPAEVSMLLGAFTHGTAHTYDCDVHGSCPATYTGTDVPLLHLPLVVLTDRNCASACDALSGAVKDLRLGTLVGTRTAGIVAAPAAPYLLDDASLIILPARHQLSAHHELINDIGVAPDYYVPLTAHDLND